MTSRLAIIQGHPDPDPGRYCRALADAYAEGAEAAGHEVTRIDLARLDFPLLRTQEDFLHGSVPQELEPAKEAILRAEHLVFVFPLWLGTMPALLKGFLEQIMRPGVAFAYGKRGFPETLLKGRSARIVVTMGMPAFFYRWWFLGHGLRGMRRNILPRLQAMGIRTFAEAERASFQLAREQDEQARAGWADPVARPVPQPFAAIDPFAYQHRVGDLMATPPIVVRHETSLRSAIGLMAERRVGSVLASQGGQHSHHKGEYGILTERDVLRLLAAEGEGSFERRAGELASRPLISIRAQTFAYRAIGRMDRLGIRHLGVHDEKEALIGVVSARDLLRLRARAAIQLDDMIDAARSGAEMAAAWASLPSVASALVAEKIEARTVAEIVSEELRAMTRRAAILAEEEMRVAGLGDPPSPYAVLVLGSAGRGESLLAADQDNAIVFERGTPGGPEDRRFGALGGRIAAILDTAGIAYCKGGVMAKNEEWRGSLDLWRERISQWMRRSRPQDLLNIDIFFDLVPVHGERRLGEILLEEAYSFGHKDATFPLVLGERLANLPTPFTLFGGLRTEEGRTDLKRYALFPLVSAARALSIRHDIRARSTKARLEGLLERQSVVCSPHMSSCSR